MEHVATAAPLAIRRPAGPQWWAVFALAVTGLALCVTALWLGSREVMAVGGACADGGPYVNAVPCPDGVGVLVAPSLPLGFAFAGVLALAGSRVAGGAGALATLAWPALFLSMGWNFLEFGLDPAAGGTDWGFLTCAVIFALMGGVPLAFVPALVGGMQRRVAVLLVFGVAAGAGVVAGRALAAAVTG